MLVELREKVALLRKRLEDPSLPASPDETDAKILSELQEKTFQRCLEASMKQEKEGKCRCCYISCNKLFKGEDFLAKHMRTKHEDFAADQLLLDAESFMRKRYEAEPMGTRPLPPVEVETHGRTELKSVKAILDKYVYHAGSQATSMRGNRENNPRRASGGEGRRGQDDRDRRVNGGGNGPIHQQVQYVQPQSENNFSRKIASYVDVDAPKVSAVVNDTRYLYLYCIRMVVLCDCFILVRFSTI